MRVINPGDVRRTRSAAEIFRGPVEMFTAVGGDESRDLRLTEVHFQDGARNRWHVHSTDQILVVTEGEGTVATGEQEHDVEKGTIVFVPANTRHWHGAKPGRSMTHWAILGPAETKIVD